MKRPRRRRIARAIISAGIETIKEELDWKLEHSGHTKDELNRLRELYEEFRDVAKQLRTLIGEEW